jgi:hypothetical protein
VVVSSQFLIDSEASLKGVEARLNNEPAPTAANTAPAPQGEGQDRGDRSRHVTLSHGPIPSSEWGAMTMEFKLPPANGCRAAWRSATASTSSSTWTRPMARPQPRARCCRPKPHLPRSRKEEQVAMIAALIRWSIVNRFLVLLATRDRHRLGRVGSCSARRWTRCPTCRTCR